MKKNLVSIICILSMISLSSFIFCKRQGITGHVYLVKGNQMPSPAAKPGPGKGMKTTIYIYELTALNQVRQVAGSSFYEAIYSRLIKQAESDEKGYFKVRLDPGEYSIFIKKDSLFYGNLFDEKNNIVPVKVTKGSFVKIDIRADYDAVY